MLMSSEEGAYRLRYGEKGVDWVDADPDGVAFTGEPADIRVINETAFNDINNTCWHTVTSTIAINSENEATQITGDMNEWNKHKMQVMSDIYKYFYEAEAKNPDVLVKGLRYTAEEADASESYRTNTNAWIRECRATFCTGQGALTDPSDDAQWAEYLAGLEKNGISQWQELVQMVYDRTKGE